MSRIIFLLISMVFVQLPTAQSQTAIFDEMMGWINNSTVFNPSHNHKGYKMMMSNNTIRNAPSTPTFQYISYTLGSIERAAGSPEKFKELIFKGISHSFIDQDGKVNANRDQIDVRIYKTSTAVKVDIKLLTWGGGVGVHDATIERTILGGYCLRFKSNQANYYTIMLSPFTYQAPE
ncbi:hypothetical protein [Haliscomenobacter hydrossis]|uniref:Uncharacterized protein n=1 Tax=Haliscomenobacter hydrossis (strain ATCC 27775 / DSM 1100 / LMG 10767 / O) TaxID=760192 RepID=F4KUI3_HALH1|nr:hypothetical protein [Haliscomenobacter hydrossis]AEE52419.1 hypothetical protein Halhy_4580 [Haliscomenobacter hydrossis DSM 1100]